jgi:hypothetical protein
LPEELIGGTGNDLICIVRCCRIGIADIEDGVEIDTVVDVFAVAQNPLVEVVILTSIPNGNSFVRR